MFLQAARWVRSVAVAVDRIEPPQEPRLVVDVGAGPGVVACVLAETFRSARVIAVDGSPELLELAARPRRRLGLGERVVTQVAELPDGLGDVGVDGSSGHRAGPATSSTTSATSGRGRAGRRAGSPRWSARRRGGRTAHADAAARHRCGPARTRGPPRRREHLLVCRDARRPAWTRPVVEHWPGLLTGAGLELVGSRTFLLDLPAPLDPAPASRRAPVRHTREHLDEWLDTEDRATLDLLLDADRRSPCIGETTSSSSRRARSTSAGRADRAAGGRGRDVRRAGRGAARGRLRVRRGRGHLDLEAADGREDVATRWPPGEVRRRAARARSRLRRLRRRARRAPARRLRAAAALGRARRGGRRQAERVRDRRPVVVDLGCGPVPCSWHSSRGGLPGLRGRSEPGGGRLRAREPGWHRRRGDHRRWLGCAPGPRPRARST